MSYRWAENKATAFGGGYIAYNSSLVQYPPAVETAETPFTWDVGGEGDTKIVDTSLHPRVTTSDTAVLRQGYTNK